MFKDFLVDIKVFLALLFFGIFLALFDILNFLNPVKSLLQTFTIPIQYGFYKTGTNIAKQFEFIVLSRKASQENKALSEQLAVVLSENANLRKRLAETQGFLEQENSLDPQIYNMVAARPIGVSSGRFLIIDKGSNDNLKINFPVVYKDNYIGIIKEISPKQSKIMLSSDPDSKISVFTSNVDGKARGVLFGQFGSELLLDKVLHREPIQINDLVYTEGVEENLPRGLILGSVVEVIDKPNEVFKQAKVKPIFEIDNLDVVFVIKE